MLINKAFKYFSGVINSLLKLLVKNKKKILPWFNYLLPLFLIIIVGALIYLPEANSLDYRKRTLEIDKDSSVSSILWQLQAKGLVRNYYNAKAVMVLSGFDKQIHAGKYEVYPAMNLKTIFAVVREKQGLSLNSAQRVLIPEGFSFQEIVDRLDSQGIVSKNAFIKYVKTLDKDYWKGRYPFLENNKLDNLHFFEGYLFPDTYLFAENTTPEQALDLMLSTFQNYAVPLINSENNTKYNIHEIVTLASIVEKEAESQAERPLIAGVFLNRLKMVMSLGSCPTVKYALGKPRKKFLLYKDLNVVSPYNTYRHLGLPPGPICSPGLASFKAVLNPEKTSYLYFVAKGDGTHLFGNSFKEHEQNKQDVGLGKIVY